MTFLVILIDLFVIETYPVSVSRANDVARIQPSLYVV